MKLQHKIAGTILLPLAAAAMISTAQAADVTSYGRIQVHVNETTPKGGDMDFSASANESRFGLKADNGMGAKGHLEFDMNASSVRLRHAYVTFDGITVGQTWKPSAALELLFPTVDPTGNALTSAPSVRVGQVSTKLDLGAGSSLNVGVYDEGKNTKSAVPSIAAKYVGDMGGLTVLAALDLAQKDGTGGTGNSDSSTTITAGVVADVSGMQVKGAFSNYKMGSAKTTYLGASVSMPMGEGTKLNAAFETQTEGTSTDAFWINMMTKTASGVDVGVEYRNGHNETSVIAGMANYNF